MDMPKKRRIVGVAAFSATALASLLGVQSASAEPNPNAADPPGLCQARPGTGDAASFAFKQGWPSKWQGARCQNPEEGSIYDWWRKAET